MDRLPTQDGSDPPSFTAQSPLVQHAALWPLVMNSGPDSSLPTLGGILIPGVSWAHSFPAAAESQALKHAVRPC